MKEYVYNGVSYYINWVNTDPTDENVGHVGVYKNVDDADPFGTVSTSEGSVVSTGFPANRRFREALDSVCASYVDSYDGASLRGFFQSLP